MTIQPSKIVKIADHISYGVWKTDLNEKDRYDFIALQILVKDYIKSIIEFNTKINEAYAIYLKSNSRRIRFQREEKKQ